MGDIMSHSVLLSPSAPTSPTTSDMRVLIVEDNPRLAASIQQAISEQGHSAHVCLTGYEAEDLAAEDVYDMYILDVMLPDRSGIDICKNLRTMGISAPVLMLTALSNTTNKVEGLDAGADDYLTKPFEYDELVARVRALLRRGTASQSTKLTVDDVELDLSRRSVKRDGESIKFTSKELALLEYFMRNPDRVLTRSSIMQSVWETEYEPGSNIVDVYVSNLRKKLTENGGKQLIHTMIGTGYRFGPDPE